MDIRTDVDTTKAVQDSAGSADEELSSSGEVQTPPENPGMPYTLGVLLIHGVGDQKRGETVTYAGEPLYLWIKSWVEGAHRKYQREQADASLFDPPKWAAVSIENTRLTERIPSEGDAPPYGVMRFQKDAKTTSPEDERWVLAESFWADELTAPTFDELLKWGLGMGPWMLNRSGPPLLHRMTDAIDRRWKVARAVINADRGQNLLMKGFSTVAAAILTLFEAPIIWLIKVFSAALFPVVGFLVQILMLALQVLSLVPGLNNTVLSIQRSLSAGLAGDAYLMAISPVRMNSTISQVQRDIDWLRARCNKVAIIAHSGGGKVTFETLSVPGAKNRNIAVFVSYGSGLNKQTALERILPQDSDWTGMFFAVSPFLLMGSVVLGILSVLPVGSMNLPWIPFAAAQPLWLLFVPLSILLFAAFAIIGSIVKRKNRGVGVPMPPYNAPEGVLWRDFYALADIISDGKTYMTVEHDDPNAWSTSVEVSNLHSIIKDHDSYWKNDEEFIGEVAPELFKAANSSAFITAHDQKTLTKARILRRNRVYVYLAAGILSAFSIPLLCLGLGAGFIALGTTVGTAVSSILSITGMEKVYLTVADPSFWGYFWGFVSVIVAVTLWHHITLFPAWRLWSRKEREEMFKRNYDDTRHRSATAFLALVCVIPFFTLATLLWRAFAPTNTLQGDITPVVNWVLSTVRLISTPSDPLVATVTTIVAILIACTAIIISVAALVIAFAGRRFLSIDYTTIEKIEAKVADDWRHKEAEREAKHARKEGVPQSQTVGRP